MTFSVEDLLLLSLLNNPAPKCTLQNKGEKIAQFNVKLSECIASKPECLELCEENFTKVEGWGVIAKEASATLSVPLQIKDSLQY